MGISFHAAKVSSADSFFMLQTPSSSYIITLTADGLVLHGGWTDAIDGWTGNCAVSRIDRGLALAKENKRNLSLDTVPQEYPACGLSDMRTSAVEIELPDGTMTMDLHYAAHRIYEGKPAIPQLPSTYTLDKSEADTLEIDLQDTKYNITITLFYTVWNNRDVICRHVRVQNNEKGQTLRIRKLMSACVDFPSMEYSMMQLSGAWARECSVHVRPLVSGMQGIESRRGASSHQQNPFIALLADGAGEDSGAVFGFSLVYSGNFIARADCDFSESARFTMGINPYNFVWNLASGESFYTPELVMVRSSNGLGEMSRTFHDLYRERLCRGNWKMKERPVVINNWEATYFDFTAQKLCALADKAAEAGVELFVLDDGWFGNRCDDKRSLGDWTVNTQKLPGGLAFIAEQMHNRGMKFGLWVEPEMVSPESSLYEKHPDWCLHIPGREGCLARTQLILDLSRRDVVDWLFETLSAVFASAPIDYIKWDFNRYLTDVASKQQNVSSQMEVSHRYVLGLYSLLERITAAFPAILFESCASGGGRFDPAMLYYMPQCWTSDDTDALSRSLIQAGTGIVYPPSAMSCHVSASPNHQTGRITPLSQRAHTAMAGTYGYELDMTKLSDAEIAEVRSYTERYKKIRATVQFGNVYRLVSPWETRRKTESLCAWMTVSKDKKTAVITAVWTYMEAFPPKCILKCKGLDSASFYTDAETGVLYTGSELMAAGLPLLRENSDGGSRQIVLYQA